jgi:stalled ribosome alternative rescue factor ArfA
MKKIKTKNPILEKLFTKKFKQKILKQKKGKGSFQRKKK